MYRADVAANLHGVQTGAQIRFLAGERRLQDFLEDLFMANL